MAAEIESRIEVEGMGSALPRLKAGMMKIVSFHQKDPI